MKTLSILPALKLQSFVREILVIEKNELSDVSPLRFYADGSPGVIFYQGDYPLYFEEEITPLASLFVYGQTIKPVRFVSKGTYRMIAFCFYPHVIKSLFRIDSNTLTDSCLDLQLLHSASLQNTISELQDAYLPEKQIELLGDCIYNFYTSRKEDPNDMLAHAVTRIFKSDGQVCLKSLIKYLQISERTFERKFLYHIGVGPKMFSRICQFQSSLKQMEKEKFDKLSDIAYENGYADQSHFIRVFSEFTGYTPLEFKKQVKPSLIPAFNEMLYKALSA